MDGWETDQNEIRHILNVLVKWSLEIKQALEGLLI